ncbi:NitT/TauT family transport system permease protein [Actinoplanes lutulentus]|uniref:NitT/TauT family transport system permease protein n=1 Tax=Actinoplanes lutulentus TaxID=1287878 RepID=A0A327Z554_9ACTN|nr:ABC transporter permease [Actinoplanes lutulentus]MBB2946304.1 NitT/TauT family transport system permease protein [Actinoplanes lutulentus]RAK28757.1 NitT/TauT family transport system permease protein [Actinoplanes lutulentus]
MTSIHKVSPGPAVADVAAPPQRSAPVTVEDHDDHRGRDVKRIVVNVLRILLPIAVLVLWEFASGDPDDGALIDDFYVSTPSQIWSALQGWAQEGVLIEAIWSTLQATIVGFAVGAVLGIVVGIVLGSSPVLSGIFRPFLVSLNSIPRLALVPLFILWFGFGLQMKVALVALIVFFLVFYATYEGVRDVEQRLLDVLKVMDASRLTLQMKVRIPSAMAWIIQGLQVSIPYALVAAVTAEIIGSNTGIGYLIQRSAGTFNTAGVFAGIVVLVLVSVVINALVTVLEKRLLRWKPRNLKSAR